MLIRKWLFSYQNDYFRTLIIVFNCDKHGTHCALNATHCHQVQRTVLRWDSLYSEVIKLSSKFSASQNVHVTNLIIRVLFRESTNFSIYSRTYVIKVQLIHFKRKLQLYQHDTSIPKLTLTFKITLKYIMISFSIHIELYLIKIPFFLDGIMISTYNNDFCLLSP